MVRAMQYENTNGFAGPAGAASSSTMTPVVAMPKPGTNDEEMDTGEPCKTPSQMGRTILGLEICVLEPMDDEFEPTLGGPGPSPPVNTDDVGDDDDEPPEVTHEPIRPKALARPLPCTVRQRADNCLTHDWWEQTTQES